MDFSLIKTAVAKKFEQISKLPHVFETDIPGDEIWNTYLASFPEGTNPIFRKRTEHDCSVCRSFIKNIGNIVGIVDYKLVSIWDVEISDPNYQIVVDALSEKIKSYPIRNKFLTTLKTAGQDKTFEQILDKVHTWNHFFVNIPNKFRCDEIKIGRALSNYRAFQQVFKRGLDQFSIDTMDTVIELHHQRSLARSGESVDSVKSFKQLKLKYMELTENQKDNFCWIESVNNPTLAGLRNTVIGTLLIDLEEGHSIDAAVRSYNTKVDPTNFCRTTAPVTQSMVKRAKETLQNMGLLSSLERRFATIDDIPIEHTLYINRTKSDIINNDVFDTISTAPKKTKDYNSVEKVSIDKFIADILPSAKNISLFMTSELTSNLMSLITAQDPTCNKLFKWDNHFSWSYNNDVADSIKERVKQAGGNVTGDVCCRLAWYNLDDLDIHVIEPNGNHIHYGNKRSARTGGHLDVDMNANVGTTREPVENIYYPDISRMQPGIYKVFVQNYCKRENKDFGFDIEISYKNELTYHFKYDTAVVNHSNVEVLSFEITKNQEFNIISMKLPASKAFGLAGNMWGVDYKKFTKVKAIMLSPNFWENEVGNKHYFFILENCINPDSPRGFFNEYLRSDLKEHRKTLEIVGDKTRVPMSSDQLSGLGFSVSNPKTILCKVESTFERVIQIEF